MENPLSLPQLRKGKSKRIVLTGGPGGGKTTAGDLLRREFGPKVAFVPEAATLLFTGGYPRYYEPLAIKGFQTSCFYVQKGLETAQLAHYPERILLCDRGTLDGAAYWADGMEDFCSSMGSSLTSELSRYDAIIFLETAAAGKYSINSTMLEGGNAFRSETNDEAIKVDRKLQEIWSKHPNYHFIPNHESFLQKIRNVCVLFREILMDLEQKEDAEMRSTDT